jgi:hypothetical protein
MPVLTEVLMQCPITGWPADPKLKEIGNYSHLALEQDMEGESQSSRTIRDRFNR